MTDVVVTPTTSSPEEATEDQQLGPHRKCGVHRLESQKSSTTSAVQVNVTKKKRSVDAVVEAYLDEHPEFLNDYVKRKVSRRQLEQWLFLPFVQGGSNQPTSDASSAKLYNSQTPGKVVHCSDSSLIKTGSLLSSCVQGQEHRQERQRSRSFTPLRKLSATTFEVGGLATPILNVTSDGPSFLRTHPSSTASLPSSTNNWNNVQSIIANTTTPKTTFMSSNPESDFESSTSHSKSIKNRKDLLLKLLPSMMQKSETLSFAKCVLTSANLLMGQAEKVDLLILSCNGLEGTNYSLINDKAVITQPADQTMINSNPFLSKVLTSSNLMNVRNIMGNMVLPGGTKSPNFLISNALLGPLTNSGSSETIGCIQLYNKTDGFTEEDEDLFRHFTNVASLGLVNLQSQQEMRLELARSEVFLELARTVFACVPTRLESTMLTILTNFLSLIDCDRCQISLSDPKQPSVFRRIFDLCRSEMVMDLESPFENRLPINSECAAEVAITGNKVNMKPDQVPSTNSGSEIKSFLCLPIHDPDGQVVGVISLANKEANMVSTPESGLESVNYFTGNDERFVEAFSIFCGMAIRNASDYEKAVVSEAKLQVAFEVMNYQATSSFDEINSLCKLPVPAATSTNIDSFDFSYLSMDDNATLTATLRMFIDLGLISRFNIDYTTLCRWLLTVKRNYRNETVQYHNWYHAFNVTQMMFSTLIKTKWNQIFSQTDLLGLIVACVCHDLDHRGTNNPHQTKMNNPLATLYTTSTLERHHLNQCLLILTLKGNGILDNLTKDEYADTLAVIERSILATDLALHFRDAPAMATLASNVRQSPEILQKLVQDPKNLHLLQAGVMTSSDLGNATKPWECHRFVSQLIAEEFWTQGDIERQELNLEPQPMFDRSVALSTVQMDFLDNLCLPLYRDMAMFSIELQPLLDGAQRNRQKWLEMEESATGDNRVTERARNL